MDGRAYAEREVCGSLDELCHSLTVFLPPRAEYLHHGVIIILNFIYRYWLVWVCITCMCACTEVYMWRAEKTFLELLLFLLLFVESQLPFYSYTKNILIKSKLWRKEFIWL